MTRGGTRPEMRLVRLVTDTAERKEHSTAHAEREAQPERNGAAIGEPANIVEAFHALSRLVLGLAIEIRRATGQDVVRPMSAAALCSAVLASEPTAAPALLCASERKAGRPSGSWSNPIMSLVARALLDDSTLREGSCDPLWVRLKELGCTFSRKDGKPTLVYEGAELSRAELPRARLRVLASLRKQGRLEES